MESNDEVDKKSIKAARIPFKADCLRIHFSIRTSQASPKSKMSKVTDILYIRHASNFPCEKIALSRGGIAPVYRILLDERGALNLT